MPDAVGSGYFVKRAEDLAQDVLGKFLCRRMPDGSVMRRRITETEAYCGEDDTAAHAHKGRTVRTEVLYTGYGRVYVYRCHMFWLLNLSCGPDGSPECVLIRGVEGVAGPGRVSKAMGFSGDMYGLALAPESGIWLEDDGYVPAKVAAGPRIGIPYASERDRSAPLNFRSSEV